MAITTTTIKAITSAVTALAVLVWGVLRWWGGSGRLEKEYYDAMGKLKKKQDERTIALQVNDMVLHARLTIECTRLSQDAIAIAARLRNRGVGV